MGLLRLLLTMTVVLIHAGVAAPVGGRLTVQVFFLISGYVIAMVLNQRPTSPSAFYLGRALKIYPEYLLILVASAAILPLLGPGLPIAPGYEGAVNAANLLIVGQDWLMFTPNQHHGLWLPQTWAIGTELTFYAIAPFVVRSPARMAVLFVVSVLTRIALLSAGIGQQDPWTYRFFPAELAIFMIGALAYRYLPKYEGNGVVATMTAFTVLIFAPLLIKSPLIGSTLALGVVALMLPAMLKFDARHHWSRVVGDSCFAIFLVHILMLRVAEAATPGSVATIAGVAGSVLAGTMLRRYVSIPLDPFRRDLVKAFVSRKLTRSTDTQAANTSPSPL